MAREDEILDLYNENLPMIKSTAHRYSGIDPSVAYEDLMQEAYIAVANAVKSFIPHNGLNFSSFLYWQLQKSFHGLLKDDKVVEISGPGGEPELIPYGRFLRIKRKLPQQMEYRVISVSSSLEDLRERGKE